MATDPNTIQYVIQEDGFWYIASKDRTPGVPGITVSSKGIANGLSSIPNDGADFGPDSYDPSYSGSGVPYTQTSGIQEAVNYIGSNGGGTVQLIASSTPFDVTNAPFTTDSVSGHRYKIVLPLIPYSNTALNISIIGTGMGLADQEAWYNAQSGLALIKDTGVYSSSSHIDTYIFGSPLNANEQSSGLNNVNLYLDKLVFQTSSDSANYEGGADINNVRMWNFGILSFTTIYPSGDTSPVSYNAGTGFFMGTTPGIGAQNSGHVVNVIGYYYGVRSGFGHCSVDRIYGQFNYATIENDPTGVLGGANSTYSGYIGYLEWENGVHCILNLSNSPLRLHISLMSPGDLATTGTFAYSDSISNTAYCFIDIDEYGLGSNNTITPTFTNNSPTNSSIRIRKFGTKEDGNTYYAPTPSITPNPPASGTAYQNTNPYDILIYLPVYTSTSGTAGNVKASIGTSSSSLTQVVNDIVNSGTSSSNPRTIILKVPAGWYYEFTGTTTTFGTAIVVAD